MQSPEVWGNDGWRASYLARAEGDGEELRRKREERVRKREADRASGRIR